MYFGVEQYEVLNVNHIKGVHPENRVIGFVLLAIRPAELGKTTNTSCFPCVHVESLHFREEP